MTSLAPLDCPVVELRRYVLHPGQRDTLIELFEREFIESQEALGMAVLGQFRDLDAPDRFVWLRGFADMDSRAHGLAAFYGGPVWQQHRGAANATMIDSDDVLLLRPAWPGAGLAMRGRTRGAVAVREIPKGLVDLRIFHLHEPASAELRAFCQAVIAPCLQRAGAELLGWYVTEPAANNFPRLPVREDARVLVTLACFENTAAGLDFERSGRWAREVEPGLAGWLARAVERQRLVPTARSSLHGGRWS